MNYHDVNMFIHIYSTVCVPIHLIGTRSCSIHIVHHEIHNHKGFAHAMQTIVPIQMEQPSPCGNVTIPKGDIELNIEGIGRFTKRDGLDDATNMCHLNPPL